MSLVGCVRVSTAEGRQVLDRQLDALSTRPWTPPRRQAGRALLQIQVAFVEMKRTVIRQRGPEGEKADGPES